MKLFQIIFFALLCGINFQSAFTMHQIDVTRYAKPALKILAGATIFSMMISNDKPFNYRPHTMQRQLWAVAQTILFGASFSLVDSGIDSLVSNYCDVSPNGLNASSNVFIGTNNLKSL